MKIENTLPRIIKNNGVKEVSQLLGITQVKLKKYDLVGVDLQPLVKYLKSDDCVCSACKGSDQKVKVSEDFKDLELECTSCGSVEFSNSFICECCKTTNVVDLDSAYDNEAMYRNKVCKNCLDNATRDANLATVWTLDISYLEMLLCRLPKEKQLLIAEHICELSSEEDMKDINEFITEQKDENEGYSEEYIEVIADYLKVK